MKDRQEQILNTIIKEHIKTGQPVGSEVIVNKYKLGVSSATVRNVMADLETDGWIIQPHTSAGRVPTERAYRLFLESLKEKRLSEAEEQALAGLLAEPDEPALKQTAKAVAQASGLAVFWAFYRNNLYYTGVANLLSQPEFSEAGLIYNISSVIDRVDEIIEAGFDQFAFGPQVLLGSENPFSPICAAILSKYRLGDHVGLYGILGPMRMNYEKNLALVRFIDRVLNHQS